MDERTNNKVLTEMGDKSISIDSRRQELRVHGNWQERMIGIRMLLLHRASQSLCHLIHVTCSTASFLTLIFALPIPGHDRVFRTMLVTPFLPCMCARKIMVSWLSVRPMHSCPCTVSFLNLLKDVLGHHSMDVL